MIYPFNWQLDTKVKEDTIDAIYENKDATMECAEILARPFQRVTVDEEYIDAWTAYNYV